MATAKHYEQDGNEKGTVELPASLFGCDVNDAVLHQATVRYLANQRQGTASTKGRSQVQGGGKKPYRQKGTGRARAGTIRSPIWRGGGVVFGPHPRDYRQEMPRKMRHIALTSALSIRASGGEVAVIDDVRFEEPKTKRFAELLGKMGADDAKILFVLDQPDTALYKSARNVPGVSVTLANTLNVYEILWADKLVLTQSALKKVEEVYSK